MSSLFILVVIMFNVGVVQATQIPRLEPVSPAPSAPYWTYLAKAGSAVRTVAVSADGKTIVAGCNDHSIYVFGSESNATIWKYRTGSIVRSVVVSDNGSTIVAGSADQFIYAFSRSDNTTLWKYKTGALVPCVSISADGNTIVAGSQDGFIYVFSRSSNSTLWRFNCISQVMSVAVSADGNTIVAGGSDQHIRVFSRSSNATLWQYQPKAGSVGLDVLTVAISADGNTIAASAASTTRYGIYTFGRASNSTLWTYNASSWVWGVAVSRDGTTVATGGVDCYLRTFARTSNTTLISYNTTAWMYRSVAISSDASSIVCGNSAFPANNSKVLFFSKTLGFVGNCTISQGIGGSTGDSGLSAGISGNGTISAYGGESGKIFVFNYNIPQAPPQSNPSELPITIIALIIGAVAILAIVAIVLLAKRSKGTSRKKQ